MQVPFRVWIHRASPIGTEFLLVLKGHGFSLAIRRPKWIAALAAEGMHIVERTFPQGLKPPASAHALVARLKPRPFKTQARSDWAMRHSEGTRPRPFKARRFGSPARFSADRVACHCWLVAAILTAAQLLSAQAPQPVPDAQAPETTPAAQAPAASQTAQADKLAAPDARPIAIVPLDSEISGSAAEVTGDLQVYNGRAFVAANAAITAGSQAAHVTLPYRGTLLVCAYTIVKLAADSSVPAGQVPGLLLAMDHGALEMSFATTSGVSRNSDILLTPDFRILIAGPGAAELKVRLGPMGDTCVDNAGANAPYVLVSSVFDGGAYRVQPGQRVMFQHGSLHEVVDQEKESCGCPAGEPKGNEFPVAQSEGLAPMPASPGEVKSDGAQSLPIPPMVYNSADHAPKGAPDAQPAATPPPAAPAAEKKPGFLTRVGHFFRRIFGAE